MLRLFFTVLILLCSSPAHGLPAIGCHCFRDRSFDPERPYAADPYILATTQNSLMAIVFNLDKSRLVKKKMTGTNSDDLWIARWLISQTGLDYYDVTGARMNSTDWNGALWFLGIAGERRKRLFGEIPDEGAVTDSFLAGKVVDQVLVSRLGIARKTVQELRRQGATNKEVILASFLSRRSGVSAVDYFRKAAGGKKSWGSILWGLGMRPEDIEIELRKMLN